MDNIAVLRKMNKKSHTLIFQRIDGEMFKKVFFYEIREKNEDDDNSERDGEEIGGIFGR